MRCFHVGVEDWYFRCETGYYMGHWRRLCLCVDDSHMGSVTWGHKLVSSEWFIAVFAFVNSLDLCTVKKQTSCGMTDKTSTWILTNTEWKDCNWMLFFLPWMPVSMFYHYKHGNCEKPPYVFQCLWFWMTWKDVLPFAKVKSSSFCIRWLVLRDFIVI